MTKLINWIRAYKKYLAPFITILLTLFITTLLYTTTTAHAALSKQYSKKPKTSLKNNWQEKIPAILKKWIPWILRDYNKKNAPFSYNNFNDKTYILPYKLNLSVNDKNGKFILKVKIYKKGWVIIPGNAKCWPQQVKSNYLPVPVIPKGNLPAVYLYPGDYQINGEFNWQNPPEALKLPQNLGLINLKVNGEKVPHPNLDKQGRLWIKQKTAKTTDADTLDIKVFRHITDDIPFMLDTKIMLNVSGKNREIILDNVLLPNFIALKLAGRLPVRLEDNGSLYIKLRPGKWIIDISSYCNKPVYSLTLPPAIPPWPKEEIWVFNAKNNLRTVNIEGVPSIDSRQTELPRKWSRLPAYYLKPDDELKLIEKKRGDDKTQPNMLNLSRNIWLDFDGAGYTIADTITGRINNN